MAAGFAEICMSRARIIYLDLAYTPAYRLLQETGARADGAPLLARISEDPPSSRRGPGCRVQRAWYINAPGITQSTWIRDLAIG